MRYSRRQFLITSAILAAQVALGLKNRARADSGERYRRYSDLSPIERRVLAAEIAAQPVPPVTPIGTSEDILWPFDYRRLISETPVTVFDAPGGSPIRTIPAGFNFVSIVNSQNGWTQINYGEWVPDEVISPAHISTFTGVTFDRPLTYPLAWILLDTRPSTRPGAEPPDDAPLLARYTPVSVFARQQIAGWEWYLVGPDQWVEQRRLGQALPVAPPAGVSGRWIGVDLYEQVLIAYEDTRPVFATLVSSGLPDWPTDEGLFRIEPTLRFESTPMRGALGGPDSYIIEDIPWTMFYNLLSEEALHGTFWHDGFGYRHSHGCVNLTITDARWLYQWTADGYEDAWVYVYSSGEYNE